MKFDVYTYNAGCNNGDEAKLRESTRMALLAFGLTRLGHDVHLVKPNPVLVNSESVLPGSTRWQYFSHMEGPARKDAIVIDAADSQRKCDVAFRCSVGFRKDHEHLKRCKILVAHETSDEMLDHPRVVHVPFMLHELPMRDLIERDLPFACYMRDELEMLREIVDAQPFKPNLWARKCSTVCYCGVGWSERKQLLKDGPGWADIRFYDTHPSGMTGWQHMRWLRWYSAGFVLRGDTPKVNLTPLMALLGVPIIGLFAEHNTPKLDENSMIFFDDWDALYDKVHDEELLKRISDNATKAYLKGWSPTGQARLVVNALEGK